MDFTHSEKGTAKQQKE